MPYTHSLSLSAYQTHLFLEKIPAYQESAFNSLVSEPQTCLLPAYFLIFPFPISMISPSFFPNSFFYPCALNSFFWSRILCHSVPPPPFKAILKGSLVFLFLHHNLLFLFFPCLHSQINWVKSSFNSVSICYAFFYHLALATPPRWNWTCLEHQCFPQRHFSIFCAVCVVFKTSQSCSDSPSPFSTPDLTEFLSTILITCSLSALELLKYLCFLSLYPWPSSYLCSVSWIVSFIPGFSLQVDVANLPEICVSSPVLPTRLSANISSFWLDGHCLLLKFSMTEMELMISPWKAVSLLKWSHLDWWCHLLLSLLCHKSKCHLYHLSPYPDCLQVYSRFISASFSSLAWLMLSVFLQPSCF